MIEIEMGYRGSKSDQPTPIPPTHVREVSVSVKEQRVDGSSM